MIENPDNARINASIREIDSLFGDVISNMNQTETEKPRGSSLAIYGIIAVVVCLSLILLVYLYTAMRRPTFHSSRKVILPPSVRRKMKKTAEGLSSVPLS